MKNNTPQPYDKDIYDYHEALKKKGVNGAQRLTAEQFNVSTRTVNNAIKRVKKLGPDLWIKSISRDRLEDNIATATPEGQVLKGSSALLDADGNVKIQWVKTDKAKEDQLNQIKEIIDGFVKDIKPIEQIEPVNAEADHNLLTVIPFGDPHFGLYCWADEVGESFDLEIAERDLCNAVKHLVDITPTSNKCLIANLGDFFHADNISGTTTRSGHVLDMASRPADMINVGLRAMRFCIEYAAQKFNEVEVINAIGNHDDITSMFLGAALNNIYADNPRIKIQDNARHRHYVRHGRVLIGVTHGHETKDQDLALLMANDMKEDWGQTRHRYFYRGHHHHDSKKEYNGCIVEQFRTLAPNDSYAHNHGWLSGRDMKAVIHHVKYGEVARHTCSIDMLRSKDNEAN
jgi:hypothetical protein